MSTKLSKELLDAVFSTKPVGWTAFRRKSALLEIPYPANWTQDTTPRGSITLRPAQSRDIREGVNRVYSPAMLTWGGEGQASDGAALDAWWANYRSNAGSGFKVHESERITLGGILTQVILHDYQRPSGKYTCFVTARARGGSFFYFDATGAPEDIERFRPELVPVLANLRMYPSAADFDAGKMPTQAPSKHDALPQPEAQQLSAGMRSDAAFRVTWDGWTHMVRIAKVDGGWGANYLVNGSLVQNYKYETDYKDSPMVVYRFHPSGTLASGSNAPSQIVIELKLPLEPKPTDLSVTVVSAAGTKETMIGRRRLKGEEPTDNSNQRPVSSPGDLLVGKEPKDESNQRPVPSQGDVLRAARGGGHDAIMKLVKEGGDLNARGNHGQTALHSLALDSDDNLALVELLVGCGALVDPKDRNGATPLHFAADGGNKEIAALLLERGADINAVDVKGRTPLFFAKDSGHSKVADLLRQRGAG